MTMTDKPAESLEAGDVLVTPRGDYPVLHVLVRRYKANVLLDGPWGPIERDYDRTAIVTVQA